MLRVDMELQEVPEAEDFRGWHMPLLVTMEGATANSSQFPYASNHSTRRIYVFALCTSAPQLNFLPSGYCTSFVKSRIDFAGALLRELRDPLRL
jgi:hypothetical protein